MTGSNTKNRYPSLSVQNEVTDFLLYTAPGSEVKVEVLLSNETLWLTQKRMAELFAVGVPAVSKHLDNIYSEGELERRATISILETVQKEGHRNVTRKIEYYNLDAVISVGYRVNSAQATQFRIWATKLIKEYIIKGFTMDDERLKNGRYFGKDYFKELLERIRSIRASERRIYLHEIKKLERAVSSFFDYIEGIIERRNSFTMESFAESVNKFLEFNEYKLLEGYGTVSRKQAEQKAWLEYERFNKTQKIESDFDKQSKAFLEAQKKLGDKHEF